MILLEKKIEEFPHVYMLTFVPVEFIPIMFMIAGCANSAITTINILKIR